MKRLTLIAVLVSAAALAGSREETATYVDGNVPSVAPKTGGTLVLSEEKTMVFRTGLDKVEVPYAGITNAELGAVEETTHNAPLYKVWALHKRFTGGNKTETQLLIVNFKTDSGEERSMTLELSPAAAGGVLSTLESRTGKTFRSERAAGAAKPAPQAKNADAWWGDEFWKTTRNAEKWDKPGSN